MAANLTPQYLRAERQYRQAAAAEDELYWLQVMLRELPKHKGTDKLHAELKQKISRLKRAAESAPVARRTSSWIMPRQGAGRVLLIGAPNAGKSRLLSWLTHAQPLVADYPFSTRAPLPGMLEWGDVSIQIVDTPPITADVFDPQFHGLIRGADLVLLVVDFSHDDGWQQAVDVIDRLRQTRTRLATTSYLDDDDLGASYTRTLLVAAKMDVPGARERYATWSAAPDRLDWPSIAVDVDSPSDREQLSQAIFESLDVVRVYTKHPREKQPTMERPYTLPRGATVMEVAELVHHDLARQLKHARLWSRGSSQPTQVRPDHIVDDGDIVELH
ncbi:MAG: GTPase [Pirellulales bacterium]